MKRSIVAVAIAAVSILLVAFEGSALARRPLLQISSDPFTNVGSQHKTEVEPDTLARGKTFVSTFQVGRFFSGGAADIGFATSTNGGNTFTQGFLPDTTPYSNPPSTVYARDSDPSVAFDAKHGVWLTSYLGLFPHGNESQVDVLVSRSTDGGLTWGSPVPVNTDGNFNDKNWTTCDNTPSSPFYGNCYTQFDNATVGDQIQMSTSSDGGLTWGPAQTTQGGDFGIGGQPLVQPNGTVIVPIVGFSANGFLIMSFISKDGGATWSKAVEVSKAAFRPPRGDIRATIPLPSAEMDKSGKVYVTWSDCRFEPGCTASDLVLTTSSNGLTWSPVTRIPLDPVASGVDHFIPGLAVDRSTTGPRARLAVTYYFYPVSNCQTSTCQLDVGSSASSNGGATWAPRAHIAGPMRLTWLPNTSQGYMVGDYISTSFVSGPAFPAFAAASAPTQGGSNCLTATPHCNEATFTVAAGLSSAHAVSARERAKAGGRDVRTRSSHTAQ